MSSKLQSNKTLSHEVQRWLTAEARGRQEEAETALRSVFALLPMLPLPAHLPQNVLRRAGIGARSDFFARRWVRFSIAASFLLVGALAAYVPILAATAGAGITLSGVVSLIGQASEAFGGALAGGVAAAQQIFEFGGLLLKAVLTPTFTFFFTATALLTLAALRCLTDLNFDRGESGYAEPI